MAEAQTIIPNLLWKFAERILAQGVSFIVSVVLARLLLPEDYGILAIVFVLIAFADVFIVSGFSTALIQKKDADEIDFSTNFYCSAIVSVALYGIVFFCAPVISRFYDLPLLIPVIRVMGIKILIGSYNSIQHAYVSRHMEFRKFFFSTLIGTIISGVLGIIAAWKGLGPWALVIQYLSNTMIDLIVLSFTVKWRPTLSFSWTSAKSMMRYGWKVFAADFSGVFFEQLRTIIIGKKYTTSDLAYYDRGRHISSLISDNVNASVLAVMFPAFSNANGNEGMVKEMLRKSVRMLAFVLLPIGFGLSASSENIIRVIYTDKWIDSLVIMQVLSISSVIGIFGINSLQAMKAIGRSDVVLKLELVKKPIYLVLLLIGVKINVEWIAITMLIYTIYSTVINVIPLKKLVGYSFGEQISDTILSFILSGMVYVAVYFMNHLPWNRIVCLCLQVVIGVVVYFLTSYIVNRKSYTEFWDAVKGLAQAKE